MAELPRAWLSEDGERLMVATTGGTEYTLLPWEAREVFDSLVKLAAERLQHMRERGEV
jgi:hypothetical protein